jgi:VWFA-related protein
MRMTAVFFLSAGLALTAILAYSQDQRESSAGPPIKLETDLVVLDAHVVHRKTGRIVGGLGKDDFSLFEDGVKQEITHFSQDKLPLSIIFLVDVSESVWPGMHEIEAAALQALEHLKPEDEVGLMVFAGYPSLVRGLTKDRRLISDEIQRLDQRKGYGTSIDEAVYQAAATLSKAANPDSRRVIVAITDDESNQAPGKGHSEQETTNELFESGSVVCGLLVGPYPLDHDLIDRIIDKLPSRGRNRDFKHSIIPHSNETGGIVLTAKKKETASKLTQLIDRLRSCYSLGYVASNQKRDGTFRKITLKVSPEVEMREGGVAITTRRGYYARRTHATTKFVPDKPATAGPSICLRIQASK